PFPSDHAAQELAHQVGDQVSCPDMCNLAKVHVELLGQRCLTNRKDLPGQVKSGVREISGNENTPPPRNLATREMLSCSNHGTDNPSAVAATEHLSRGQVSW